MKTREDLIAERTALLADAEATLDRADREGRDLSDTERADHDALLSTIETLNAQIGRADRIEKIRTAAASPHNRMAGSSVDDLPTARDLAGRNGRQPWINRSAGPMETETDLRSRALDAIDLMRNASDGSKQAMTLLVEHPRHGTEAAEHLLAVSDPTYKAAFLGMVRNPQSYIGWDTAKREAWDRVTSTRTAMSLTPGNGGYLLPFELDPSIMLSNAGTTNFIRQFARVEKVTQNVWHGVSSAGVTAEWTAEAAEAADASPTFVQPTVTCYKGDAYVQASYEVLEDSNIESDIASLIADAKDRLEATAFTVGNGTTQPAGIVTRLAAVTASRVSSTTNGAYGSPDVYAVDNALSPRWRNNASWLANRSILNLTRQFATGSGPQSAFWADLGAGLPPNLIGYPVGQASDMTSSLSAATASTDNILVLGDFRQYLIADRIGVSMVFEPLVKGASRRPTGEVGWYVHWRTGGDVLINDAFRLLQV